MAEKHDRETPAGKQEASLEPERVEEEAAGPAGDALKPERVQWKPAGKTETAGPSEGVDDPGTGSG
jgi:hypothetical protein